MQQNSQEIYTYFPKNKLLGNTTSACKTSKGEDIA